MSAQHYSRRRMRKALRPLEGERRKVKPVKVQTLVPVMWHGGLTHRVKLVVSTGSSSDKGSRRA